MPVEPVLSEMEKGRNEECATGLSFGRLSRSLFVCVFRLKELVKAFLDDPDPDETLLLGPDMRKIQFCFSLLKVTFTLMSFMDSICMGLLYLYVSILCTS